MSVRCEACDREFGSQEALDMHNSAKHNIAPKAKSFKFSRKTAMWTVGILAVILVGYFFIYGNGQSQNTKATGNAVSDGIQRITLGFTNTYTPNTIIVEAGKPVELTLDSDVNGCYRAFNIPGLGVSKYSKSAADKFFSCRAKKGNSNSDAGWGWHEER